jgi:benzoate/toluate 1,2-dioxygenase subunit beta
MMTTQGVHARDPHLYGIVAQLIFDEARAADEQRFDDWLAFWNTGPIVYWVPYPGAQGNRARQVSIINDDQDRLRDRIARLKSQAAPSGEIITPTSTVRTVGSVRIESNSDAALTVTSTYVLVQARLVGETIVLGARQEHVMSKSSGSYKLVKKTVWLANALNALPTLTFLL